ncbi:MAG: Na+/H+ antiporter NhaA [Planctomycetota bacterium]|nr:MAG: Na+/H+ antiporter NhaA [Planctomycetota bacterium]
MAQARPTRNSLPLPKEPVHRITAPILRFIHVQSASGVVLLLATIAALVVANGAAAEAVHHLWTTPIGISIGDFSLNLSLEHWVNDGLMAIFFFVVGLEVKREIVLGELRQLRKAALPIAAALGGMLAPALIYLALQRGEPGERGWGIPMATDIAFVVGCMAVLGNRVPHGLRVMLLSLAIVDDIGAILVIAVAYSSNLHTDWLLAAVVGLILVHLAARAGVRSFAPYVVLGAFVWLAVHESGIHATIAGVVLGLMTPARSYINRGLFGEILDRLGDVWQGDDDASHAPDNAEKVRRIQWAARETLSPLEYLESTLHPWVAFLIMPIFALANAGVAFELGRLADPVAIAVAVGLLVGKPLGVFAFCYASVRMKIAALPAGVGWGMIAAGGCLSGIGFTMALFIANLALAPLGDEVLSAGKIGVLCGSAAAAIIGMGMFLALPNGRRRADALP